MAGTSPTVRQRELGRRLRELRTQQNLTVEEIGEKLLCSATKISRLETGTRRPSLRDVRDLCDVYGIDEVTSAELMTLAQEAREHGWWTQYEDLRLDPYLGLEQDAVAITSYTMYYFPALLQTKDYAQTVINAVAPKMDPAILNQRVEVRMRRQLLLEQDSRPFYRVLLDEAVLRRSVGGPMVMAAQIDKVLKTEARGQVTVQVIPYSAGAHAAIDSNFVLFEFRESPDLSPVVFVEGLTGNQYLERKADIVRYREAIEHLRDSAHRPSDSLSLMAEIRGTYVSRS